MQTQQQLSAQTAQCLEEIRRVAGEITPRAAIVLGSGLGDLGDQVERPITISYDRLPGFPGTGVAGHKGQLIIGELGGQSVVLMQGRAHYYEHGNPQVMFPALDVFSQLNTERLILTNAAGSLVPEMGPGNLMLIEDHINFSGTNPLFGFTGNERFVNMSDAYDADLRQQLAECAKELDIPLQKGVYCWFSGPSFETPAEIRAAQILGAQAVGMSTVPEVIFARYFGLKTMAISNITNLGAGLSNEVLAHEHTMAMSKQGGAKLQKLLIHFLQKLPN